MTLRITTLEKENSNLDHQVHDLQKECNALTEEIEKHKAEYANLAKSHTIAIQYKNGEIEEL